MSPPDIDATEAALSALAKQCPDPDRALVRLLDEMDRLWDERAGARPEWMRELRRRTTVVREAGRLQ